MPSRIKWLFPKDKKCKHPSTEACFNAWGVLKRWRCLDCDAYVNTTKVLRPFTESELRCQAVLKRLSIPSKFTAVD